MFVASTPPKTLTKAEQSRLVRTVARNGNPRDLALLSLALGTGLRLRELVGLNVGHVAPNSREVAWKVDLPKNLTKGRRGGVAFLSQKVRSELRRYLAWKRKRGEQVTPDSPLFLSIQKRRISLRRVQFIFIHWQEAAGFELIYNFHALFCTEARLDADTRRRAEKISVHRLIRIT
jgi:site-specific recombinase XerC